MDLSGARWKSKSFSAMAAANPMSGIVMQLQISLSESKSIAILSGCDVILEAGPEQAELLNRAAFGRSLVNSDKEKQWFQLGPEEAFYLYHALGCLKITAENGNQIGEKELWDHMRSRRESFPDLYKVYWHLRSKNWVVRSGMQYGVDFVAYRHHPALIHSEYAVIVASEGAGADNKFGRLKTWSDLHCTLRACGSVAKTLLVLTVNSSGSDRNSPNCLKELTVDERTITRWMPERCREEGDPVEEDGVK